MSHPYLDFIQNVEKPSRYFGGEFGEIVKDWQTASCRVCLAFPDVYEVGMSHLGFRILYSIINQQKNLLAERAYAPWIDMEQQLRKAGQPLRSLESARPLSDFDIVGFSLQFELSFTNILQMLELGRIPLRSEQRTDAHPLILAGGPNATHPEPIAPFIDAFLIGDGESAIVEILQVFSELRQKGARREQCLQGLADVKGIYVPAFYQTQPDPITGMHYVAQSTKKQAKLPIERAFIEDIDEHPFPVDGPVANTETIFDRASVEIARGCTQGCRFCQAGMIYRPVRERDPEHIIEVVKDTVINCGYEAASLTSLSPADYSAISQLLHRLSTELHGCQTSLVISSLRAYGLQREVLEDLRKGRASGLTFAPEAGSQRMRDVINKNISEAQLMETAKEVFHCGWSKIKLYFMIGLPTETDEDVEQIIALSTRTQKIGRSIRGKRAHVVVSVSTHVPKPHTPFQWCAMDSPQTIERKHGLIKQRCYGVPITLRLHDTASSWLEGVLARGDKRLSRVIESAYRNGARFDSWSEQFNLQIWIRAFEQHEVKPNDYLQEIPLEAHLPWEHIQVGVHREHLEKEYQYALKGRTRPPCAEVYREEPNPTNTDNVRTDKRAYICYQCGMDCDLDKIALRREQAFTKLAVAKQAESLSQSSIEKSPVKPVQSKGSSPAVQNEPIRMRLSYSKLKEAVFGSHLDLVRLFPRICKRAGLSLLFSQGFHPKAILTYGPALSVGIYAIREYVDIKLTEEAPFDAETLVQRLSDASIKGIRFLSARKLTSQDAKLNRVINQAVYVVGLSSSSLKSLGLDSIAALQDRIDRQRESELLVRRRVQNNEKVIDLHHYLQAVQAGQGEEVLRKAGLGNELVPLTIRLRITGGGTAKISEAVEALLGSLPVDVVYVRSDLLWTDDEFSCTPMDLQALRRKP